MEIETQRRALLVEVEAAWARALAAQWDAGLALVGLFDALGSLRQRGFWRKRAPPRLRVVGERRWRHGEYGRYLGAAVRKEALTPEDEALLESVERPRTRLDCMPGGMNAARPCPFLSCRYHLGVEIAHNADTGEPQWMRHMLEWEEDGGPSCALDVADQGARMPTEVGVITGMTKQGAVFVVKRALAALDDAAQDAGIEPQDLLRGIDAMREEAAMDRSAVL